MKHKIVFFIGLFFFFACSTKDAVFEKRLVVKKDHSSLLGNWKLKTVKSPKDDNSSTTFYDKEDYLYVFYPDGRF